MDFRLDMYMLSNVFLNHATCTRCTSALSFWEVVVWILQSSPSNCSSMSYRTSLVSSFGRLNVTIFVGGVTWLVAGASSSDSLESHRVLLPVESSSDIRSGVASGFWSFLNCLKHVQVGCSLLHSLHHLGVLMSFLSTWLM